MKKNTFSDEVYYLDSDKNLSNIRINDISDREKEYGFDLLEFFHKLDWYHGSGIDCVWYISTLKNGKIKCSNSWHLMNDNGMYIGFIDFSIIVPVDNPNNFRLVFHTNAAGYYWIEKIQLRDYLETTLDFSEVTVY